MSNLGVHDFAIPHEYVQPTRDMAIIQLPYPPKKVGSLLIPDIFRDMAKHNVAAGRIVSVGPLAFWFKNGSGVMERHKAAVGDWVTIRPFAGTHVLGGKLQVGGGFRYVSTFQDVIGIIPFDKMPDPATLLWDEDDSETGLTAPAKEAFGGEARERTTIKG